MTVRTGGQVLVKQLLIHGVSKIFCVPGESFLAATDALYDVAEHIDLFVCRQEGGAATMAEAYGKLTGEPGVCFVTRGPGATNASIAVHIAQQDSTPMVLFVGQINSAHTGREAFQELDYPRVFGGLAKWATQVDDAARLPEVIRRAFTTATSGRPGPVVVALPENMLSSVVDVRDSIRYGTSQASPDAAALADLAELLAAARRPVLIVGGGGWDQEAATRVTDFAERWRLPAVTSFRRQDLITHRSSSYAGALGPGADPKLMQRVREADLLLVVGARLGEMTTAGYTVIEAPIPVQQLVHVHASAEELGRVYEAKLAINSGPRQFAAQLVLLDPPTELPWSSLTSDARAEHVAHATPRPKDIELDLADVVTHINSVVPRDTVITNGAGNYTTWVHRFYEFTEHPCQLGPTNGSMGYGLPAAIAACVTYPDRTVIAFAGDGCLLMTGQELATAMQYDLRMIVIVINNGHYGTIRLHQEKRFPGRVIGTGLRNPDFVAFAESFGLHAERVIRTKDFPAAFERARVAGRVALIELITDPEQATPDTLLSSVRAATPQNSDQDARQGNR
jgi:acetolactate synthase-1/2/3 large subunit